ncbi:polymorphic outer membrane protein, partial [Reticulomyxa filosa]
MQWNSFDSLVTAHTSLLAVKDSTFKSNKVTNSTINLWDNQINFWLDNNVFDNSLWSASSQQSQSCVGVKIVSTASSSAQNSVDLVKITNNQWTNFKTSALCLSNTRPFLIESNTFETSDTYGNGIVRITSSSVGSLHQNTFNSITSSSTIHEGSSGVVLKNSGTSVQLLNNIFKNMHSTGSNGKGGAVYAIDNVYCTIIGGSFSNNLASEGASIFAQDSVQISDSSDYGSIYSQHSVNLTLVNITASQCTGAVNGGVVYSRASVLTIIESQFSNNTCNGGNGGGAIAINDVQMKLQSITFSYNKCKQSNCNGGSVYASNGSTISWNDITFFQSKSLNGGGGAFYFENVASFNLQQTISTDCMSSSEGGVGKIILQSVNTNANSIIQQWHDQGSADSGGQGYLLHVAATASELTQNLGQASLYIDGITFELQNPSQNSSLFSFADVSVVLNGLNYDRITANGGSLMRWQRSSNDNADRSHIISIQNCSFSRLNNWQMGLFVLENLSSNDKAYFRNIVLDHNQKTTIVTTDFVPGKASTQPKIIFRQVTWKNYVHSSSPLIDASIDSTKQSKCNATNTKLVVDISNNNIINITDTVWIQASCVDVQVKNNQISNILYPHGSFLINGQTWSNIHLSSNTFQNTNGTILYSFETSSATLSNIHINQHYNNFLRIQPKTTASKAKFARILLNQVNFISNDGPLIASVPTSTDSSKCNKNWVCPQTTNTYNTTGIMQWNNVHFKQNTINGNQNLIYLQYQRTLIKTSTWNDNYCGA